MQRRTFLKRTGAAVAPLVLASRIAAAGEGEQSGRGAQLDTKRLAARNQNRSTVVVRHGVAATEQPLATMAAVDVLKAGGTAADAAVAANAMLTLVEPGMCGPGGDLFAIVWSEADRKLFGLNASGRSPYDWSLDDALAKGWNEIPADSPLAWSVPGCVSGWEALLARFGKLGLARVLEPAIACAREGFPLSPLVARSWPRGGENDRFLAGTYLPEGKRPGFGDVFANPQLAGFFEILARDGAAAFYQGPIAERIVRYSQAQGGRFSLRDFRDHRADWVEPVTSSYRGYDVWELPPNGQGIAALEILNMLECFDIAALAPNSARQLHLFLEAKKLAFEDRAVYYADPQFADVPVEALISKDYARRRAKLIDPRRASQKVAAGTFQSEAETTYLTAADCHGNMVSLIQSNYYEWGSRYVPDSLGFCLQNRGQLFALDPKHRNRLAPHKRPFHTIIPAFVTREGDPVFSFGVMGGDFQPQGHAQVLMNLLDFGMSPQQAGEQPRVCHFDSSTPTGQAMAGGGTVGLERGIPETVRNELAEMGHAIRDELGAYGGYQGIWRRESPRRYFAGSDPRKDGCAIGY